LQFGKVLVNCSSYKLCAYSVRALLEICLENLTIEEMWIKNE